ncbi:MAG: hypothetical protein VW445_10450 [Rhodospirillaceae bacterium]|jgi:hypothetical protein
MGGAVLLLVLVLAVGILQVMLFFKIWVMTDNVEKIYKLLKKNFVKGDESNHSNPSAPQQ